MKKIKALRRQGLLLMALGLGIVVGKIGINESLIFFCILMIIWLFSYDYAVENNFGRKERNEQNRSTEAGEDGSRDMVPTEQATYSGTPTYRKDEAEWRIKKSK